MFEISMRPSLTGETQKRGWKLEGELGPRRWRRAVEIYMGWSQNVSPLRTRTISDSFRWFPAQHKAWHIACSQYVSGMNRIQESRATKVPVLHAIRIDAEDSQERRGEDGG